LERTKLIKNVYWSRTILIVKDWNSALNFAIQVDRKTYQEHNLWNCSHGGETRTSRTCV